MPEPMTKRVAITLPDLIYEHLEKRAKEEGRPVANLAAYLVERGIKTDEKLKP